MDWRTSGPFRTVLDALKTPKQGHFRVDAKVVLRAPDGPEVREALAARARQEYAEALRQRIEELDEI